MHNLRGSFRKVSIAAGGLLLVQQAYLGDFVFLYFFPDGEWF